jgi:hypothetical protein
LSAESVVTLPPITASQPLTLQAEIRDGEGDVVARATVDWLVEPHRATTAARAADRPTAHV